MARALEERPVDRRALALRCGQLAPAVAILVATTLDGEFVWADSG